jgi:serpin B
MATLGRATVALGDDLLARVDEKGNVVFAPASVSAALSMTWAGARGDTATQMAKTLHLDGLSGGDAASGRAHAAWGALLASWSVKGEKEPVVEVANRLFGQQGYPFTPAFLALTKDRYGAALEPVDYVGATEAARGTINKWVSERTAKAIPELIGKGVLDKDTRLTLVNAIHLKGAWIEPFNAAATSPAKFHAPGGDVDVPTMNGVRHARWAETKDAQIVSLPFASAGAYDLELDVVLPSEKAGKPSLTAWSAAIDAAEQTHVSLSLPRFKVSSNLPLSKTLAAMGMPDAFSKEKADFSGIDGKKDLYVWAVVH